LVYVLNIVIALDKANDNGIVIDLGIVIDPNIANDIGLSIYLNLAIGLNIKIASYIANRHGHCLRS